MNQDSYRNSYRDSKAFMFAYRQDSTLFHVYVFSEVDARWDPQRYQAQPRGIDKYQPGSSSLAAKEKAVSFEKYKWFFNKLTGVLLLQAY